MPGAPSNCCVGQVLTTGVALRRQGHPPKVVSLVITRVGIGAVDEFEAVLTGVYDSAANPDLWPGTLEKIPVIGRLRLCHVRVRRLLVPTNDSIAMQKVNPAPGTPAGSEPGALLAEPAGHRRPMAVRHRCAMGADGAPGRGRISPYGLYREWLQPQALRDCLNILYHDRKLQRGVVTFATEAGKPLFGEREKQLAAGWLRISGARSRSTAWLTGTICQCRFTGVCLTPCRSPC